MCQTMRRGRSIVHLAALAVGGAAAFSAGPAIAPASLSCRPPSQLSAHDAGDAPRIGRALAGAAVSLAVLLAPQHGLADEWGKETEAPTLFTGETVMICKKRGPLGACTETAIRTVENDNDKALKYFKDPSQKVKERQERMLQSSAEDSEGNALIQKLRMQSEANKEKNDLIVRQKTLLNDQGASFGPFDRQVVILNTDGKTFTLLQNPQAMRLKKAGYIEDRKFVIQPSQKVIDDALEGENLDLGGAIKGFFGGGDGTGGEVEVQVEVASPTVVEEAAVVDVGTVEDAGSVDDAGTVESASAESAPEAASDSI